MKRFFFAVILLILVLGFNSLCLFGVVWLKNDLCEKLDLLLVSIETESDIEIAEKADEFTEYWLEKQHILGRIVRHELIDETTIAVSRLSSLARYGEKGELSAEICRCRILITEICDSEFPVPRNIF